MRFNESLYSEKASKMRHNISDSAMTQSNQSTDSGFIFCVGTLACLLENNSFLSIIRGQIILLEFTWLDINTSLLMLVMNNKNKTETHS